MELINLKTQFISAKTASELSGKAVNRVVEELVAELIPVINRAVETSCSNGRYYAEIDLTKYDHLTSIYAKLANELAAAGYKTKLVDDDHRGYYIYITWN